jgi:hypothetical protein
MKLSKFIALGIVLASCGCTRQSAPPSNVLPKIEVVGFYSGKNGSNDGIKCPINIVPGTSIGPLILGMPKGNLMSIDLKMKALRDANDNLLVGPFMVVLNAGKVSQVSVEPLFAKECLQFQGSKISKDATLDQLKNIFPNCEKEQDNFGGKTIQCDKVSLHKGSLADSAPTITIEVEGADSE